MHPVDGTPRPTSLSSTGTFDGDPVVYWAQPQLLQVLACTGGDVAWSVAKGDTPVSNGTMTEGPDGTFTATIPAFFPVHDLVTFTIAITGCDDAEDDVTYSFGVYIDPSGFVKTVGGDPIEGATVTLYRSDTPGGPFTKVADGSDVMSETNRSNPDIDGHGSRVRLGRDGRLLQRCGHEVGLQGPRVLGQARRDRRPHDPAARHGHRPPSQLQRRWWRRRWWWW